MDLQQYSVKELNDILKRIPVEIARREERVKLDIIKEMEQRAAAVGVSLHDVANMILADKRRGKRPAAAAN